MICNPKVNCKDCKNPTTTYENSPVVGKMVYGSNRYLTGITKETRGSLIKWWQNRFGKYTREKTAGSLKSRARTKMSKQLVEKGYKAVQNLMIWYDNNKKAENENKEPEINEENKQKLKHFFRCVIASEPQYQTMHIQISDIFIKNDLDYLTNEQSMSMHKNKIQLYSPILCDLFYSDLNFPDSFYNLLKHMADKCDKLYTKSCAILAHDVVVPTDEQKKDLLDYKKSGTFYGASWKRIRPKYKQDTISKCKQAMEDISDVTKCNKNYSSFCGINGGIFKAHCGIHGINLGYHVIPNCEGLNDNFSYQYTHMDTPPISNSTDFNCGGLGYAMRREPQFFGKTIHLIDHIHHNGHTACSDPFSSKHFKSKGAAQFRPLNSAASEQRNRVINKIRLASSYMNFGNFNITVRHMLEMDNIKMKRAINGCYVW